MQEIKLDPKYVSLVMNRTKTQTIRFGKRKYDTGKAKLNAKNLLIPINIVDIEFVPVSRLDKIDAKRDGFSSVDELKEALKHHYPHITESNWVTVVSFELDKTC